MSVPAIGNVVTPPNFTLMSAEGQVLLSWDLTPLATIYYINRSTDGVSFSNIASTTMLSYNDDSCDLDTVYYYQIQAGNGTASSVATQTLTGIPLKPGETTLGNMRLEAQQRSDFINDPFISTQEWNTYISQSWKELIDLLVEAYGSNYYVKEPYSYTTDGSSLAYPLPSDFYKLLLVEVALNPGDPNSWVTLRKYEFIQKNLWNYPNVYTFYGVTNLRYRLMGTDLTLVPIASAGQTVRIWYVPRPSQLVSDTDIVDGISGWEEYVIVDACIKALTKEETECQNFKEQKMALLARIDGIKNTRDVGEPEKVSDSKLRNFAWGDDGSFGGGNGGMW